MTRTPALVTGMRPMVMDGMALAPANASRRSAPVVMTNRFPGGVANAAVPVCVRFASGLFCLMVVPRRPYSARTRLLAGSGIVRTGDVQRPADRVRRCVAARRWHEVHAFVFLVILLHVILVAEVDLGDQQLADGCLCNRVAADFLTAGRSWATA